MVLTPERLEAILAAVAAGEPVRQALRTQGVPPGNFYPAVRANPEIAERYWKAKSDGLDSLADEAVQIADDRSIDPNDKRIMVETRKWLLSKLAPKRYGERLNVAGADGEGPVELVVSWREKST